MSNLFFLSIFAFFHHLTCTNNDYTETPSYTKSSHRLTLWHAQDHFIKYEQTISNRQILKTYSLTSGDSWSVDGRMIGVPVTDGYVVHVYWTSNTHCNCTAAIISPCDDLNIIQTGEIHQVNELKFIRRWSPTMVSFFWRLPHYTK